MSIIGIQGGLGAGKSYIGVSFAYDDYLSGVPVYSNFPCRFATRLTTWREVCMLRDGVFLWDESHLDIDSRSFASNVAITPWLTQTRKLGVDVRYITQDFSQVDVRLRKLTDILLHCEAVESAGAARGTRVRVIKLLTTEIVSDVVIMHDPVIYSLYDSYAPVFPLKGSIPTLEEIWGVAI